MSTSYTAEETAEHRKLWSGALRSGKYSQSKFQLRQDVERWDADHDKVIAPVGFCCLGVACDVALKAGVIGGYEGQNALLPPAVINWLGLPLGSGGGDTEISGGEGSYSLWELNDDQGYSFEQIADVIDAGLVRLADDES